MILQLLKNRQITVQNILREGKAPNRLSLLAKKSCLGLGSTLLTLSIGLTSQAADDHSVLVNPPENAPDAAMVAPFAEVSTAEASASPSRCRAEPASQSRTTIASPSESGERVLRWHSPTIPSRAAIQQERSSSPVRQVNHISERNARNGGVVQAAQVEPLDDPFNDRARETLVPIEGEVNLESPQRREDYRLSLALDPANPDAQQPSSLGDPAPGGGELPHSLPGGNGRLNGNPNGNGTPCDDIFNNRNTCDERDACHTAIALLDENKLADYDPNFLNITPLYDSRSDDISATQRIWHNRQGEIIADGQLVDYREGKITVEESNGNQIFISEHELSEVDLSFVTAWWSLPPECRLSDEFYAHHEQYMIRPWGEPTFFTWKASALCHKPLYFEDVSLERYGHSSGPVRQPLLSGAHFFLNVAILPYRMGMNPPQECQYALGYYRVGSCSPWLIHAFPISGRGALAQAAVFTGFPAFIP